MDHIACGDVHGPRERACQYDLPGLDPRAMRRELVDEPGDAGGRAVHPLSPRTEIAWSDLASFDLVALVQGSGIHTLIDRHLPTGDILGTANYEIAKIHSILDIIQQSDCVSVLPALALAYTEALRKFHHRPMRDPEIKRDVGLISPRKIYPRPRKPFPES